MERGIALSNRAIGVFITSLTRGGAERFVSILLPFLLSQNIKVHLILMDSVIEYDVPKNLKIHYIKTDGRKSSKVGKFLELPFLAYKLAIIVKRNEITHLFSLLSRPNFINILSKTFFKNQSKIIISERALPSLQYGYGDIQSKVNNILIKKLYPKSNTIICNSNGNAQDLISNYGIPIKKTRVINNPLPMNQIRSQPKSNNLFDKNFVNLITVGRLDEGKNHAMLINAVRDLKNVKLYIIGVGSLQQHLIEIITTHGLEEKVILLGFQENPFKYLKAADLFVFSSNHEGFPNAILEAMACGLPIISTNCKSGPAEIMKLEKVSSNELMLTDYGILVPINNKELMRSGIKYLIHNPKFLEKCKKNVVVRAMDFDLEKISQKYLTEILS